LKNIGKAQRLIETIQGLGGPTTDAVELIKNAYCQIDETVRISNISLENSQQIQNNSMSYWNARY